MTPEKKHHHISILTILLVIVFSLTWKPSESLGQILINYNGDFALSEIGDTPHDEIPGWTFRHWLEEYANDELLNDYRIVEAPEELGGKALEVDIFSPFGGGREWFIQAVNDEIPIDPGGVYLASFWVRSDSPGALARLRVQYYDAPDNNMGGVLAELDTEWERYGFIFTTHRDDDYWSRAIFNLNFEDNAGKKIYIANLEILELAGPPEPVEPGEPVNENGGFEVAATEDIPNFIYGWEFDGHGDLGEFSIVTDPVFEGEQALRLDILDGFQNPWNLEATNNIVRVEPGKTYDLSVWAKTDQPGTEMRAVAQNRRFDWYEAQRVELTDEWEEITFRFTIDDNSFDIYSALQFGFEGNENTTVYVDALTIREFIIDPGTPINVNAGFEDSPPGHTPADSISGWSFNGHEENLATFQTVSEPVYEGESALEIDITGIGEVPWSVEAASENIPVTPGYTYQLTAMVRSAVPGATMNVWVQDLEFSAYARVGSDDLTLTTDWQMLYTEFTVGDDTEYVRVPFHMGLDENIGNKIYLDNVIVSQITEDGEPTASDPSAPENRHELPESMTLHQNYPNPFNPATQIRFDLAEPGHVTLTVYDMLGQRVATLADTPMSTGQHEVTFDATGLSSGIYLYRLSSGNRTLTRSMLLMK